MPNFTKKNLQGEKRVCWRLRSMREARGLSIEAVANHTKINKTYLLALEECRFEDIPFSSLYIKNFVKKYVTAMGEDPEPFISQFYIEEMDAVEAVPVVPKKHAWLFFTAWPSVLRNTFLGLAGLSVVFYLGLQVKHTIAPPTLSLVGPDNGFIAYDNTIKLQGASEPATTIMINGQIIKSDEQGNFSEAIALAPGVNTIVVEAKKKHGKTTQTTRHIIYRESEHLSAQNNVLGATN